MSRTRPSALALPLALALAMSDTANAQPPANAKPVNGGACATSATVVTLKVTDANGTAVDPVRVTMRRKRDGKMLPDGIRMRAGQAEFQLLESDALAWLSAGGDVIEVEATAGDKRARVEITVGRDASGCGIARVEGPMSIVLR
ncbi:hypothetical protein [Gemmatimonas sp.]